MSAKSGAMLKFCFSRQEAEAWAREHCKGIPTVIDSSDDFSGYGVWQALVASPTNVVPLRSKPNGVTPATYRAPVTNQAGAAVVTALSDVPLEKLVSVFPGFLWRGKYTLLSGNPGLGKSTVGLDIAARLSRGGQVSPYSPETFSPCTSLVVSSEDGAGDTIKPRVIAAGGDEKRIKLLSGILTPEGKLSHPNLGQHLREIVAAIREHDARLLILDPVTSFFGGIDSNSQTDVRGLIDPFIALLQETGCALLGVVHLNKAAQQKAIFRVGGSIAMIGAPRAAFAFVRDEEATDPTAARLLLPIKNNLQREPEGYRLALVDADVQGCTYARIEWAAERCRVGVDEVLNPEPKPASERAAQLVAELLSSGEKVLSTSIFAATKSRGLGEKSTYAALRALGTQKSREGVSGPWTYQLRTPIEVTDAEFEKVPG